MEDLRVNAKFTEEDIINFFNDKVENRTGFLKNAIRCYIAFLEANPHIIDSNLKNVNVFNFKSTAPVAGAPAETPPAPGDVDELNNDLNDDIPF